MLIIAERINATRKAIAAAIANRDAELIRKEALNQSDAGADYIDINAGGASDEAEALKWILGLVQEVTDKPLCLDSADPTVIESVINHCRKPPIINSITLDHEKMGSILSLVAEHGAKVIGLCQSEQAMGKTCESKLAFADQLVKAVTGSGVSIGDLYIDPLVFPLSTDNRTAISSLEAIERIMVEFPGVHTVCGLTNVSYGLPARKLVNRTFLICALSRGLDAAIIDPTDNALYSAMASAEAVLGRDDYCMGFISSYRKGRLV